MEERTLLRDARVAQGWSLEYVAERLGVTWNTVSRWELGKETPHPKNVHRLCKLYGKSPEELGLSHRRYGSPSVQGEAAHIWPVPGFVKEDLTMRLLALGFLGLTFQQVQDQVKRILEEYDAMNHDLITRRHAIRSLATSLFLTYLNPLRGIEPRLSDDLIRQCAASIAGCWELSRSNEAEDITLAYESATTFAQLLRHLIHEASHTQERQTVFSLLAQCEILLNLQSLQFNDLKAAVWHGKEAVTAGAQSADIPLHLSALKCLAWTFYYDEQSAQAVKSMGEAILVLKEHKAKLPLYVHSNIYSTLALMQAKDGQDADEALRYAEKNLCNDGAPMYVDPPIPAFIRNAGMTRFHQRNYKEAMKLLEQLIDPATLQTKYTFPVRARFEVVNVMAMITLKRPDKNMEMTARLIEEGAHGAIMLHSPQRFHEVLNAYDIAEGVWSGEQCIADLRAKVKRP